MLKRILILGVAALALALIAPAVGGTHVAKAQTVPEQGDAPEAPDQGDAPEAPDDQGDAPEAPDQGDADDDGGDAEDGACDSSGARASGDSCPPPLRQPAQPAPGGTRSDRSEKQSSSGGSGSGGQEVGSRSNEIRSRPTQVVQATTPVSAGVDTGTIPQGGIQAGAGGTADDGSNAGLLGGGALILVLAASGLALRRRDGLAS